MIGIILRGCIEKDGWSDLYSIRQKWCRDSNGFDLDPQYPETNNNIDKEVLNVLPRGIKAVNCKYGECGLQDYSGTGELEASDIGAIVISAVIAASLIACNHFL